MHKIAIIKIDEIWNYEEYQSYSNKIAESITDWEDVSHEDFVLLKAAEYKFEYKVIERIINLPTFIPKTIADYKAILLKEQQEKEAAEKKRKDAALAKKMKKDLKDKESKIELFKKLQAELGDTVK